jgi:hypothetical protein
LLCYYAGEDLLSIQGEFMRKNVIGFFAFLLSRMAS